jgi:hypothetical protein
MTPEIGSSPPNSGAHLPAAPWPPVAVTALQTATRDKHHHPSHKPRITLFNIQFPTRTVTGTG